MLILIYQIVMMTLDSVKNSSYQYIYIFCFNNQYFCFLFPGGHDKEVVDVGQCFFRQFDWFSSFFLEILTQFGFYSKSKVYTFLENNHKLTLVTKVKLFMQLNSIYIWNYEVFLKETDL